jgi:hypothetical protein
MLHDEAPKPTTLIDLRAVWRAEAVTWPLAPGASVGGPHGAALSGKAPLLVRGASSPAQVQGTTLPALGPDQAYVLTRTFSVGQPDAIDSLMLEAKFIGGFAAYINGQEVLRHHLSPDDRYDPKAVAFPVPHIAREGHQGFAQRAFPGLDPAALRPGDNTLAIVLHPRRSGGGDRLLFDARLDAYTSPMGFVKGPYLQHVTDSQAVVMFEASGLVSGRVEYGPAGGGLSKATTSAATGSRHEVTLTDLTPNTRYFYRVRAQRAGTPSAARPSDALASKVYHFLTAPAPGDDSPFVFLAYGDNRSQPKVHSAMVQRMLLEDPSFILNTGDLTEVGVDARQWQTQFFDPARPLMRYAPMWPSLGNHEGNHVSYYEHFSLPNNESWYAFRYGNLEVFALNTAYELGAGSEQLLWFEGALAASTARWKVAFFHHPPFSCTAGRMPGFGPARRHLVPLFERYGVQLVFTGHDHLYGRGEQGGVTYVITGGGGAYTYPPQVEPPNLLCERVHHYCQVRVEGDRLQVRAIDIDGREVDAFTLHAR